MADNRDREKTNEEETTEQVKPVVKRDTEDELTAGEETITHHIAAGIPTDATIAGTRQRHRSAHPHGEEDYQEGLEDSESTGPINAGKEESSS